MDQFQPTLWLSFLNGMKPSILMYCLGVPGLFLAERGSTKKD